MKTLILVLFTISSLFGCGAEFYVHVDGEVEFRIINCTNPTTALQIELCATSENPDIDCSAPANDLEAAICAEILSGGTEPTTEKVLVE